MNILFSYPWELITSHGIEVVNNFVEMNNTVHLVTFWKDRPPNLNKQIHLINASVRNRHLLQFLDRNLWQYGAEIVKKRWFNGSLRKSFYYYTIEKIIKEYSIDVIYERHVGDDVGTQIAYKYGIPSVLEINGIWPVEAQQKEFSKEYCEQVLRQELISFAKATSIRAVSMGIRDFYVERGIDARKFRVIGNGANVDNFRPMDQCVCRKQLGFQQDEKIVGFTGSFQSYMGLENVIAAMPFVLLKLPNIRFFLMGRVMPHGCGPSFEELYAQARELGVEDKLTLTPASSYEEVPQYINSFNVCLVSLRAVQNERSPLKLHEYLACGKPVVASRIDSIDEFHGIEKERVGLLHEPENPQDLAEKIIYLLTHEDEAFQMGERGRRYVMECKSWKKITEQILELMRQAKMELI